MGFGNMSHPMILGGGTIKAVFTVGDHRAVLIQDPDSFGPIKYRFVLTIFDTNGTSPLMFVTCEWNEMQEEQEDLLEDFFRKEFPDSDDISERSKYHLCVFALGQHANLGQSDDWADIAKFESAAWRIVRERLGVSSAPQVIHRN